MPHDGSSEYSRGVLIPTRTRFIGSLAGRWRQLIMTTFSQNTSFIMNDKQRTVMTNSHGRQSLQSVGRRLLRRKDSHLNTRPNFISRTNTVKLADIDHSPPMNMLHFSYYTHTAKPPIKTTSTDRPPTYMDWLFS